MSIDQFTQEAFEAALPVDADGAPLWESLGLQSGEYMYAVPVIRADGRQVRIVIRSSVGPDGVAADTGEDSIRAWLEGLAYHGSRTHTLRPDGPDFDLPPAEWFEGGYDPDVDRAGFIPEAFYQEVWHSLGKGASRWITRVSGWHVRLVGRNGDGEMQKEDALLRVLYKMGLRVSPCPTCGMWKRVYVVRKEGDNKGRIFEKCHSCDSGFRWLD